jgi:hypothetical protein
MRPQRLLVQFVAQDRIGRNVLPFAAEVGFPLAIVPLTRLNWPAITVTLVAATAGPAGPCFEVAIPVVIEGMANTSVAGLCLGRSMQDGSYCDSDQCRQPGDDRVASNRSAHVPLIAVCCLVLAVSILAKFKTP